MKKRPNKKNKLQKRTDKKVNANIVMEDTGVYNANSKSKTRQRYTDYKIGKIEIVKDFLPAPNELRFKDATVKVTLNLSKASVLFFKEIAQNNGSQYQKVIRILLDQYTSIYTK